MTASYLDETWFDGQAGELAALQAKLIEHLDVIALAAGQMPDLVAQVKRLEQREQEARSGLEDVRGKALAEIQGLTSGSTAQLNGRAIELVAALEGQAGTLGAGLSTLTGQLRDDLAAQHASLKELLAQQVKVTLDSLPASMRAIEVLNGELRTQVQGHLEGIEGRIGERERVLLETLTALEEELQARLASFQGQLEAQLHNRTQALTALEERWQEQLQSVEQTEAEAARQASERAAQLGERLSTLEAEVADLRGNQVGLADQVKELQRELGSTADTLGYVGARVVGWRNAAEAHNAETKEQMLAFEERLALQSRHQEGELERLRQALDEHGRQVRQTFDGVTEEQRNVERRISRDIEAEVRKLQEAVRHERAQVQRRLDDLGNQTRAEQKTLGIQVEALGRDAGELRSELSKVGGRLSAFLGWFNRAGTWARLNGKPED